MAPLVRTGGSRHTGLAAPPHRNIHWTRGYYVETIGNITDEAVQKYIKEQAEESRREDSRSTAL